MMVSSPQTVSVLRDGEVHEAVVAWRSEGRLWTVTVDSSAFDQVEASADDAFEAQCRVREQLDAHGWHLGIMGARPDVWPSGMARDMGSGLRAYEMTEVSVGDLVDTFEPVDPERVVPVAAQRAEADRLYAEIERRLREPGAQA